MDLSWTQFVGLAVSSGAAAGLANQVFKFVHDKLADSRTKATQHRELEHQRTMQERELRHQRDLQREEREHQAEVRREAAFFEARRDLLGNAAAVYEWIQWWWGDLYGAEVDYYPVSLNPPQVVQTAADAITALSEIAAKHPSREIRVFARNLSDSIDGTVNMPDQDGDSSPSVNQLSGWSKRAAALIDALHDPTYQPVVPAP